MKTTTNSISQKNIGNSEAIIIGVFNSGTTKKPILQMPKSIELVEKALEINLNNNQFKTFSASFLEHLIIRPLKPQNPKAIVLLGLGKSSELKQDKLRRLGCTCFEIGKKLKVNNIATLFELKNLSQTNNHMQMLAECITLGNYAFDKYKSKKRPNYLQSIDILLTKPTLTDMEGIDTGQIIAKNINIARDLINETAENLTPEIFAKQAKNTAKDFCLSVDVFDHKKLKELGLNLMLAVGRGSPKHALARLIRLQYKPKKSKVKSHICLVGKGVTFDSGGLDLKPSSSMFTMKSDMSGAAAVFGTMLNIAQLKPNIQVTGYLTCAENCIGSRSYHPGDVIVSRKGLSVEIGNTDAEGRLMLADTLAFAESEEKPDLLINIATLTGACKIALGPSTAGVFSSNKFLASQICETAKDAGESFWHMPLTEALCDQLKSDIADIKNCGERFGGAITAGLFLQKFVEQKEKWCHIDIAGAAFSSKKDSYKPKGGIGFGVRTLTDFILANPKIN